MKKRTRLWLTRLLAIAALSFAAQPAQAAVTILGEQDFADGVIVGSGTFLGASANEIAPFHDFNGSGDAAGPNFTAAFTFNFVVDQIAGATITIGILDHDSLAAGNQIAFFGFDGNDLTSLLNTALEGRGGANGEYNIYTIDIPQSAFLSLQDGSAAFTLTLQGPGIGVTGATAFNGAGLDFASLNIVPEPTIATLVTIGLLGGGALWRRAIKRRLRA